MVTAGIGSGQGTRPTAWAPLDLVAPIQTESGNALGTPGGQALLLEGERVTVSGTVSGTGLYVHAVYERGGHDSDVVSSAQFDGGSPDISVTADVSAGAGVRTTPTVGLGFNALPNTALATGVRAKPKLVLRIARTAFTTSSIGIRPNVTLKAGVNLFSSLTSAEGKRNKVSLTAENSVPLFITPSVSNAIGLRQRASINALGLSFNLDTRKSYGVTLTHKPVRGHKFNGTLRVSSSNLFSPEPNIDVQLRDTVVIVMED